MNSKFEEKISTEFTRNHLTSIIKSSYETLDKNIETCEEIGINPELFRQINFDDSKLYRLLYIAVQEYHNCLSRYLQKRGIELPDLDTLVCEDVPLQK